MTKLSSNALLQEALASVDFAPLDAHRKLKARFWSLYAADPAVDPGSISLDYAVQLTGDHRLTRYWAVSGFRQWFTNDKENEERLAYLYHLALDGLEDILLSTDPKMASARVNAIRLVAELGNRMPKDKAAIHKEHEFERMTVPQLKEFISRNNRLLGLTNPVEAASVREQDEEDSFYGRQAEKASSDSSGS